MWHRRHAEPKPRSGRIDPAPSLEGIGCRMIQALGSTHPLGDICGHANPAGGYAGRMISSSPDRTCPRVRLATFSDRNRSLWRRPRDC